MPSGPVNTIALTGRPGWSGYNSARAFPQASRVRSRSASVWAKETKAVSNCDGGRLTPWRSMALKYRAKSFVSHREAVRDVGREAAEGRNAGERQHAGREHRLHREQVERAKELFFSIRKVDGPRRFTAMIESQSSMLNFSIEVVLSIPALFTSSDPVAAVAVVVEDFEEDEAPLQAEVEARLAARICKRAAVKGGQPAVLDTVIVKEGSLTLGRSQ